MYDTAVFVSGKRIRFHANQHIMIRNVAHHRLLHMESGQGVFVFSGIRFPISPDNVYLLAPGPREVFFSGHSPVAYHFVEFDVPTRLTSEACSACRLEAPFRQALVHLIQALVLDSGPLRRQLLAAAIALALHDTATPAVADARLRHVLRHIEEYPDHALRVPELALVAGLSEPHLRRLFYAQFGFSPKRYLMRARMSYARQLLQAEGLRVGEVAALLGFPSAFHFSTQYRKVHGVAPSQDRTTATGGLRSA